MVSGQNTIVEFPSRVNTAHKRAGSADLLAFPFRPRAAAPRRDVLRLFHPAACLALYLVVSLAMWAAFIFIVRSL